MDEVGMVVEAELSLLRPDVRSSAQAVEALLDPDFVEVGASGRRWDRTAMVAALGSGEITDPDPIQATEVAGVQLADDLVHVTYVSRRTGGAPVRRSSLWRRTDGTWRLYYHQGTPADVASGNG
ncbi:nuclear transport factor 2 family protein [Kribbella sp. NBC_01510]|uniref:nuclear transport factor 2 family protein n=1 Tax=Kribbella sp. NBC_01510 TaxID=2903581 RepID=UPI00386AECF1